MASPSSTRPGVRSTLCWASIRELHCRAWCKWQPTTIPRITTAVTIQWYHNGQAIPGANHACCQWSQLIVADLGRYEVSLTSSEWTYFVPPAEIQFNSEGVSVAGARAKLCDALNSALSGISSP